MKTPILILNYISFVELVSMANSTSSSSSKTRRNTAPVSSNAKTEKLQLLLHKRQRSESIPLEVRRRYVPVFYSNPDPVLTRKLKTFLIKPPLNSQEELQSGAKIPSTICTESRELFNRKASYLMTPSKERFAHLLPEKRTIHQLLLPSINAGCRDNFNSKYTQEQGEEPIVAGDLSDQMEYLKYCRYLRVVKQSEGPKATGR